MAIQSFAHQSYHAGVSKARGHFMPQRRYILIVPLGSAPDFALDAKGVTNTSPGLRPGFSGQIPSSAESAIHPLELRSSTIPRLETKNHGAWPFHASHSKQFSELFLGKASLADKGTECAFGQLAVIGDGQASAGRLAKENMAASLMIDFITEFSEGLGRICAGADGQPANMGTSTISSTTGAGIDSLCFSRLCR